MQTSNNEQPSFKNTLSSNLDNALAPLSTGIGKTLGDLWFLAFGFISLYSDKKRLKYQDELDNFKKETLDMIADIPLVDLKEPDIQIAGQALEKSKYCMMHEDLRKMFSALIASSAKISKEDLIHPSFADIIQKMSPEDAYALKHYLSNEDSQEIIDVLLVNKNDNSFNKIVSNIWLPYCNVESVSKGSMIINSLSRLGLIEVRFDQRKAEDTLYEKIYNPDLSKAITDELRKTREDLDKFTVEIARGIVGLTDFGSAFLTCVT